MKRVSIGRMFKSAGLFLLAGCGVFSDPPEAQDTDAGDSSTTTGAPSTAGDAETTDGTTGAQTSGDSTTGGAADGSDDGAPEELPDVGVRVFPRFMLEPVSAVVTIEVDPDPDVAPIPCTFDPMDGGYLCGTEALPTSEVRIVVERDGFDPAARTVDWVPDTIVPLDVHLMIEGGTGGTWSTCVGLDVLEDCATVCQSDAQSCSPANCLTGDEADPLATVELFSSADCSDAPLARAAMACQPWELDAPPEAVAARCCCVP